jgi:hypothetical protein
VSANKKDHAMTNARTAIDAFISAKLEIDNMLERLRALSENHFNGNPEQINWADVGTLDHYRAKLREICDSAFHEGEYAQ